MPIVNIKSKNYVNINVLFSNYRKLDDLDVKFNKIIINGTVNADPLNLLEKLITSLSSFLFILVLS